MRNKPTNDWEPITLTEHGMDSFKADLIYFLDTDLIAEHDSINDCAVYYSEKLEQVERDVLEWWMPASHTRDGLRHLLSYSYDEVEEE